jgi:hypothetical protein
VLPFRFVSDFRFHRFHGDVTSLQSVAYDGKEAVYCQIAKNLQGEPAKENDQKSTVPIPLHRAFRGANRCVSTNSPPTGAAMCSTQTFTGERHFRIGFTKPIRKARFVVSIDLPWQRCRSERTRQD